MTSQLLLGATALLLIRSAFGLGVRQAETVEPSNELPPQTFREKASLSPEDLMAGGRDADEDDDFDTWYFERAGEEKPERISVNNPASHKPDSTQKWMVDEASKQCKDQAGLENGVVTYLVTRPSDLKRLKQSAPRLHRYFLRRWAYDVKVFVPSDALRKYDNSSFGNSPSPEEVRDVMREGLGEGYNWEVAPFSVEFPKVIADDAHWESKMNVCARAVSTSYKHMNQFFTKAMYEHPALDKYRYYLRIDADFNFVGDLVEDPFCMMAKSGRKFMWQTRKRIKDGYCSEGLWDWFTEYQLTHGLTPQDPIFFKWNGAWVNYVGYAGMGDLDFFRSSPVRRLAEALNEDGRIYLNRWSDQTYYVLLFALFEDHSVVGDIGFQWPENVWCHKCDREGE
jgi:hypothetical protein